MWVDHVCQPQLATFVGHELTYYCSNDLKFGTRVRSHMTNDVWNHALPISFEFFRKFMQKLKFKGSNLWNIDRSNQNRLLASCEARDGVMHGTSHCDHKHHLWTPPKSFIHYFTNNSSQTIVWPKLPKFITNSKLLKIFWNLHLWHICIN